MKGTFKVTHDTVTIEEFSYPLEQFLIDEPKFKAPDADSLTYERGEGCLLIKGEKIEKAEKAYPSDLIELFIARKRSYRGAFKARRNAAANNQTLQNNVVEAEPADEEVAETPQEKTDANVIDPNQENPDENGDGEPAVNPDEEADKKPENQAGDADSNSNLDEEKDEKPEDQEGKAETKSDESEKPQDDAPVTKENKADKKTKTQKKKENKDGSN